MAKILVIDGDELFSVALKCTLEPRGHAVTTTTDGAQGLQRVQSGSFDAVICDLMLPGCAGTAIIQDIRARRPDLCIFAISGGCQPEAEGALPVDLSDLGHARAMGATEVFVKPIRFAHLANALESALADRGLPAAE